MSIILSEAARLRPPSPPRATVEPMTGPVGPGDIVLDDRGHVFVCDAMRYTQRIARLYHRVDGADLTAWLDGRRDMLHQLFDGLRRGRLALDVCAAIQELLDASIEVGDLVRLRKGSRCH
jgi:hypothetical protein